MLVGDLRALDEASPSARLAAGEGRSGRDLLDLLSRIRAADPEEPFWRGVREMNADDGGLTVTFHEGIDPGLVRSGPQEVACHLFDTRALAAAEEAKRRASVEALG
jgi:peptide/nickel transport system ATP-binding protein